MTTQTLYDNLLELSNTNENFYFVDQVLASHTYRIFLYRLASYTDWLHPDALESRGITFRLDDDGNMVECVSRPFEKFFNLHENPLTMDLDLSTTTHVWDKMDGSLISTMILPDGTLHLKTKGSLFSDQAVAANKLINSPEYKEFLSLVWFLMGGGYTVIMEYIAPTNRIVIGYTEPKLVILAVRKIEDGSYYPLEKAVDFYASQRDKVVNEVDTELFTSVQDFVDCIPDMEGIEGFVLQLASGQRVKIKTNWYLALHHLKDSINHPRRLFEAVLRETSDDLRASFHDDPLALQQIAEMEAKAIAILNDMVSTVEAFFNKNCGLERKEYAILGQKELSKSHFSLAMNLYLGRENDYKEFIIKHYRDYGITDEREGEMESEVE